MTIRCGACHSVFWVQPLHAESGAASLSCDHCGRAYELQGWSRARSGTLARRARRLAREEEIDLPGAYALALGIMTLDEVRDLGDPCAAPCRTRVTDDASTGLPDGAGGRRKAVRYDCAFQAAIDEGLLTPRQACERGSRTAHAAILASRHRLSRSLSEDVADNRISLLEAIRRHQARAKRNPQRVSVGGRRFPVVAALAAVLVIVVSIAVAVREPSGPGPVTAGDDREVGEVQLRTDASGRIVQVAGPDPRSVLQAYCASTDRLTALRVVPLSLPEGRGRLGLIRDASRPAELLAIQIREDLEAQRWLAGDALRPLMPQPAPAGAEMAVRRQ